jgi:molybdopterin converting factor small subunit
MTVSVTFYGPLERWAGKKSFIVSEGNSIREIFHHLGNQIGKSVLEHLVNQDTGTIRSHFHVLLNGIDIDSESLKGLDQPVENGDTITCVPPVGGG